MVFNKTEEQEKEYLQEIINTLNDVINNTSVSVKKHVDTLQEYKEYLNPEKPDVPLNKNDAFQKVQKRRVQEKR